MNKILLISFGFCVFTLLMKPVFAEAKKDKELIEKAKEIAKHDLKDPDSAKFRNVRVVTKPARRDETKINTNVCGELNAKNSYGAYVGFVKFMWLTTTNSVILYDGNKNIPALNDKYNELVDYTCSE